MITYTTHDAKDIDPVDILKLEDDYGNNIPAKNKRIFTLLQKIGARVIIANSDGEYIGHYVYVAAEKWLRLPADMIIVKNKLKDIDVDIKECSVPIFVHLFPEHATLENLLNINAERVLDSVDNGFKYGIIGLNQSGNTTNDACYQSAWLDDKHLFEENTDTSINSLCEYRGDEIFLQSYI